MLCSLFNENWSSYVNCAKGVSILSKFYEEAICSLWIVRENNPCNPSKLHSESKAGNSSEVTQFKLATWTRSQSNTKHSADGELQSWRLAHLFSLVLLPAGQFYSRFNIYLSFIRWKNLCSTTVGQMKAKSKAFQTSLRSWSFLAQSMSAWLQLPTCPSLTNSKRYKRCSGYIYKMICHYVSQCICILNKDNSVFVCNSSSLAITESRVVWRYWQRNVPTSPISTSAATRSKISAPSNPW